MKKHLDSLLFLFPVMFYYAMEALIVGVFIMIVWKLILSQFLGNIGYLQIVAIYWIIKMLFFNVFNLLGGLSKIPENMQAEMENDDYDPDNMNYNESITE